MTEKKKEDCSDKNCPTHGSLSTRGTVLEGSVVSSKMDGTVVIQRKTYIKSKKYERFKRATYRVPAHNPPCINAKTGDFVRITECRRLSKTVNFVVTEILKKQDG